MKRRIILASSSAQRKALLSAIGIQFEVIPSNIDEKAIQDPDFKKRVEKLARTKGEKVGRAHKGIVIACDFFNVCDDRVLEKPKDIKEAVEMLTFLGGKEAAGYSGFYYCDHEKKIDYSCGMVIQYKFRSLSLSEIKKYTATYPVISWAAGFAIYDLYTSTFIEYLNGSLTGFTHSLPMETLIPLLRRSEVNI